MFAWLFGNKKAQSVAHLTWDGRMDRAMSQIKQMSGRYSDAKIMSRALAVYHFMLLGRTHEVTIIFRYKDGTEREVIIE